MTSTSAVKPLTMLDTNVLVDALYEDLPEYPAASYLLTLADNTDAAFCVAPQVLAEFYAIITDPRRVSAPYTAAEARQEVEKFATSEVSASCLCLWMSSIVGWNSSRRIL